MKFAVRRGITVARGKMQRGVGMYIHLTTSRSPRTIYRHVTFAAIVLMPVCVCINV
jgi:hypothetical protein